MTEFKPGDTVRFARIPRNAWGESEFLNDRFVDPTILFVYEFELGERDEIVRTLDKGGWEAFVVESIGPYGWGWVRSDDIEKVV